MNLLATAINNSGGSWDSVKGKVDAALTSMSSMSRFSDEDLAQSLATLVQHGVPVEEAIKALGTAMDTAVGTGRPLQDVSEAIGKAFEGQDSALTRIVPSIGDLKDRMGEGATNADVFQGALGTLNERFGGTAQSDANTYAGIQERLKNATGELGEKVGGILTPALATMSENLIPIVDALGKDIEAVGGWITAVGKMPEVKDAMDTVNEAFSGFTKYLSDTWDSVKNDFGPALDELSKAFGDMGDALKPLWDAFGEIITAMGGAGGDINPLKMLLEGVVLVIKGLAKVIELAVPIVKGFADGFKAAADAIAPPLKTISDAVGGFITLLTDAFQGFYDFLVGHSLWQDLWDGVTSIARTMGDTLKGIVDGIFELVKGAFNLGVEAIKEILKTGFDLAFAAVQTIVQTAIDALKLIVQPFIDLLGTGQKTWTDLVDAVAKNTVDMKGKVQALFDWLTPYWKGQVSDIAIATATKLDEINAKITSATDQMKGTWSSALDAMVSAEKNKFKEMVDDIGQQVDAIIARLRSAQSQITGHSIWPDMLSDMVQQTKDSMTAISAEFARGITGPTGIIPTIESAAPRAGSFASEASPVAPSQPFTQAITVPIHVYLDGTEIQTLLERRLVETLNQQGKSVRS
jgi:hypothetical protein